MNVVLIATQSHPVILGLRYVSSYLKAAGHNVEIVWSGPPKHGESLNRQSAALGPLLDRCRNADLVGMSVMTSGFYHASALTDWLREQGVAAPIVWGGTHATVAPDESLEVADAVCVGEGEEAARLLLERMQSGDPTSVPGMAFRPGGKFGNAGKIDNPILPLDKTLDSYPFPDYDLSTQWVIRNDKFQQARPERLRSVLHRVRIQTTRGCPYSCTFCNNTVWQELYRGKGDWVRKRTNESIVAEMKWLCERFASVEAFNIIDDLFLVRDEEVLEDFVGRYNAQVGLPLEIDVFPNMVTRAKVEILGRLPLRLVSMGIQSANPDTLRNIYRRPTTPQRIAECIQLFDEHAMPAEYHYIVGNPYESDESLLTTMRFVASHHRPSVLRIFPLMFYPGSPLYKRAREDGIIDARHADAYQPHFTWKRMLGRYSYLSLWLDILLHLRNARLPSKFAHRVIDFVTHPLVRRCLGRRGFAPAAFIVREAIRRCTKVFSNVGKPARPKAARAPRVPAATRSTVASSA